MNHRINPLELSLNVLLNLLESKNKDYEIDYNGESIIILKQKHEFLIILKRIIDQIWYSSPISGASKFKLVRLDENHFHLQDTSKLNRSLSNLLTQELDMLIESEVNSQNIKILF